MALLKFRTKQDAAEFVEEFNGKPFNTMEVGVKALTNGDLPYLF